MELVCGKYGTSDRSTGGRLGLALCPRKPPESRLAAAEAV